MAKWHAPDRPMMRRAALTVRLPGVQTMPATSTRTWSQTGAEKKPLRAAMKETRNGGTREAAAGEGVGGAMLCHRLCRIESPPILFEADPHTAAVGRPTKPGSQILVL
jgi:hypothetical protein